MEEEFENAQWHIEVDGQIWDYADSAQLAHEAYQKYFVEECARSGDYSNGDTAEQEIDLVLMSDNDKELERKTVTVHYECNHSDLQEHGTHWRGL